eukprot:10468132-Alexandrium_andersonii.AAC.1
MHPKWKVRPHCRRSIPVLRSGTRRIGHTLSGSGLVLHSGSSVLCNSIQRAASVACALPSGSRCVRTSINVGASSSPRPAQHQRTHPSSPPDATARRGTAQPTDDPPPPTTRGVAVRP